MRTLELTSISTLAPQEAASKTQAPLFQLKEGALSLLAFLEVLGAASQFAAKPHYDPAGWTFSSLFFLLLAKAETIMRTAVTVWGKLLPPFCGAEGQGASQLAFALAGAPGMALVASPK